MRDTGPDVAKSSIETMLNKFLEDSDNSALAPVPTKVPDPLVSNPGPVPLASNKKTMILVSEAGWRIPSGLLADSVAPELPSMMIEANCGL